MEMQFDEGLSRDYRGMYNGDTYERYCHRCWIWDLEPSPFNEWLAYELKMSVHAGRHVLLDKQQLIERLAARRRALPIEHAKLERNLAE